MFSILYSLSIAVLNIVTLCTGDSNEDEWEKVEAASEESDSGIANTTDEVTTVSDTTPTTAATPKVCLRRHF